MVRIDDGKGRGYQGGITPTNRFRTDAVTHTGEFSATVAGQTFLVTTGRDSVLTLTLPGASATTSPPVLMTIQNTAEDKQLVFSTIFVSASTYAVVAFERNPTLGSLGNNRTLALDSGIGNLNFASGKSPEATVNVWDETNSGMSGYTGVQPFNVNIIGTGKTAFPVDEAFSLGQNDVMGIKIQELSSAGTLPEVTVSVRFHMINNNVFEDFVE